MNWPTLDAGTLRHPITIWQEGTAVADVSGETVTPSILATAMASIEPVRGTDVIRGGQATTTLYVTVKMWYQPGILPNMQVQDETGSKFVVQSIENVSEMNVVLILNCVGLGPNQ